MIRYFIDFVYFAWICSTIDLELIFSRFQRQNTFSSLVCVMIVELKTLIGTASVLRFIK